jgi:hypothetical protein
MIKKKVFISFDFDNDQFLRNALVGQSRLEDSPFEIEDWSVKEPWDEENWKEKCLTKIKHTDLVIVMVGQKTSQCSGVKAEIKMAKEAGVPVVGFKGYPDKICPKPEGLDGYYNWTWPNIKVIVNNA